MEKQGINPEGGVPRPGPEEGFSGSHCEWNLGSPGGWVYQQMAQELGKLAWTRLNPHLNLPFDLDFEHPLFHPAPRFADMLLRAHRRRNPGVPPFITLLAERETLATVIENLKFVEYLNSLKGVDAALAAPEDLEAHRGGVGLKGRPVSLCYMDFNNDTLLKIGRSHDTAGVRQAIRERRVVNPRGMEPVGVKGVFEAITGPYKHLLSESTVGRTPWTRVFQPRRTTGPAGEEIPDLVEWTRKNFPRLILKPAQGYSGQGIFVGDREAEPDKAISTALARGGYIVQSLVDPETWQEYYPAAAGSGGVRVEARQTDFRCFITDQGLIGFLGRFGGIPTNVGSGGGTQSFALLEGEMTLEAADQRFNEALEALPAALFTRVTEEVNRRAVEIGFTYLPGPIPTSLKPRMLKAPQIAGLTQYAGKLWRDAVTLEKLWREGKLDEVAPITPEEKEMALSDPWEGSPALMVSDGLFNFRGAGW